MLRFLADQTDNIVDFLPGSEHLSKEQTATMLARAAAGLDVREQEWPVGFLEWPLWAQLPQSVRDRQRARELIKHDPLDRKSVV